MARTVPKTTPVDASLARDATRGLASNSWGLLSCSNLVRLDAVQGFVETVDIVSKSVTTFRD